MADFKKSERRVPFLRWAREWCEYAGVQLCGKTREDAADKDGNVLRVEIKVVDFVTATGCEHYVTLYPGDVAEVCRYIPRGFRHGHTARFVKGGDMMVS